MKTTRRNIVQFCELSTEWQAEALSNLDDEAYSASYFEPLDSCDPEKHVLWDLNECMSTNHPYDGHFHRIDGVIGISNNSAMAVKLSNCGTQAVTWFLQ